MDSHVFVAGPNGLCEVCGLTREACGRERQVWVAGGDLQERSVNPALVFFSQIPDSVKVFQIACTQHNAFILSTGGAVYSWGETTNALGRLLSKRDEAAIPMLIDRFSIPVVSLSCGDNHVLALDKENWVWSWGLNRFGQLGLGDKEDRSTPQRISAIQSLCRVSTGPNCSFAVSSHGNLYVWGDNRNSQLGQIVDSAGKKRGMFTEPQEVYYMPWDKGADLMIQNDKQGKTYFVKGNVEEEQIGSSTSKAELRKYEVENSNLKVQVQRLSEKITFLEDELYGQQSAPTVAWKGDNTLDDMERMKRSTLSSIKDLESKLLAISEQHRMLESDIKHLDGIIKSLEEKEADSWDELEHMENELRKMQRDSHTNLEAMKKQKKLKDDLQAQTNAISQSKAEMNTHISARKEDMDNLLEQKSGLQKQLEEQRRQAQIFDQMIYVRKKDLSSTFLERNTATLEQDLLSLINIHEALQDTSVSVVSKTMGCSSLSEVVRISNDLLTKIKVEIKRMLKPDDIPLFETLNRVWGILLENADLRVKLNDYLEGIMEHTHQKLEEFYAMHTEFQRKEHYLAKLGAKKSIFTKLLPSSKSPLRRKRRSWC